MGKGGKKGGFRFLEWRACLHLVSCKLGSDTMLMAEFANVAIFVASISCKNQLIIGIGG